MNEFILGVLEISGAKKGKLYPQIIIVGALYTLTPEVKVSNFKWFLNWKEKKNKMILIFFVHLMLQ